MASESVDLRQCFHDKTSVIVVNEIANPIYGVEPGAVGILIIQDELQVAFSCIEVPIVREYLRSAGEHERAVSPGVNDSTTIIGRVRTTAGVCRCLEILNINGGVPRDRLDDSLVLLKQVLISALRPTSSVS